MSIASPTSHFLTKEEFSFRRISKNEGQLSKNSTPLQVLESCGMFEITGTAAFDFPNFPEANKSFHLINFKLTEEFAALKGLFNGFINLGQPLGVLMVFEKDRKIYSLKYYKADEEVVNVYLNRVFRFVSEEIRFKRILRKILENQKAFAKEEGLLKAELFS
jgi:hypothetical protein